MYLGQVITHINTHTCNDSVNVIERAIIAQGIIYISTGALKISRENRVYIYLNINWNI